MRPKRKKANQIKYWDPSLADVWLNFETPYQTTYQVYAAIRNILTVSDVKNVTLIKFFFLNSSLNVL